MILTVDNGDFIFFDCAYEELLQSLGPINDTSSVPWTMFNDNVSMGYFDVYDQYILNLLYDPRIKAGMTVQEVKAVLPDVLADVRAGCGRSTIWRSRCWPLHFAPIVRLSNRTWQIDFSALHSSGVSSGGPLGGRRLAAHPRQPVLAQRMGGDNGQGPCLPFR